MNIKQTEKDFQEWFFKHYAVQYKTDEALSRIHRIAFDAWQAALNQRQAVKAEPQAWVELTDDEEFKAWHLKEYGDYSPAACRYRWQGFKAGRALNQRQAVKADQLWGYAVRGVQLENERWFFLLPTEKEGVEYYSKSEWKGKRTHEVVPLYTQPTEPLSAAQGVPEGREES